MYNFFAHGPEASTGSSTKMKVEVKVSSWSILKHSLEQIFFLLSVQIDFILLFVVLYNYFELKHELNQINPSDYTLHLMEMDYIYFF